jgi:flagellar hook assembly protein FlgD
VTIRIYDVAGRHVRTLVDGYRGQDTHRVTWNGRNAHGQQLSTGVYFYRMQAGVFVETHKMVLLK